MPVETRGSMVLQLVQPALAPREDQEEWSTEPAVLADWPPVDPALRQPAEQVVQCRHSMPVPAVAARQVPMELARPAEQEATLAVPAAAVLMEGRLQQALPDPDPPPEVRVVQEPQELPEEPVAWSQLAMRSPVVRDPAVAVVPTEEPDPIPGPMVRRAVQE